MLATKALTALIDVRKPGEFRSSHVDGAVGLDLSQLQARASEMLPDREAPLAVMCQGGYRSIAAVSLLECAGYRNLFNVVGGMGAWQSFQAAQVPA